MQVEVASTHWTGTTFPSDPQLLAILAAWRNADLQGLFTLFSINENLDGFATSKFTLRKGCMIGCIELPGSGGGLCIMSQPRAVLIFTHAQHRANRAANGFKHGGFSRQTFPGGIGEKRFS